MEFITQEEFKKIVESQDLATLNEVLSRVFNKAVETAIQMTPELTAQLVKNAVGIRKITTKFLEDNPGFDKQKDVVQKVVRDVEIANPGMDYDKVLSLAAPKIRQQLTLLDK